MPDPTRQTVSASQVPVVLRVSPYQTRYELWHAFRNGVRRAGEDDRRPWLDWGKALEDDILDWAEREIGLEVIGNRDYVRHPEHPVGATADGWAIDPELGLGWVEAKTSNEWQSSREWTDDRAPLDVEIQHQVQLMIPHPEHGLPGWGLIAASLGGLPPRLYRRRPDPKIRERVLAEVEAFLASVAAGAEPDPSGEPEERAILADRLVVEGQAFPAEQAEPPADDLSARLDDREAGA